MISSTVGVLRLSEGVEEVWNTSVVWALSRSVQPRNRSIVIVSGTPAGNSQSASRGEGDDFRYSMLCSCTALLPLLPLKKNVLGRELLVHGPCYPATPPVT